MVTPYPSDGRQVAQLIRESRLTIYDPIDPSSPLFFDLSVLEDHLRRQLRGLNLDYPLRTRSKVSKSHVAEAMGYPIPKSFKKSQPRFPGQNLDVYVQKADNLQIWNEEVDPLRRYILIRLDGESVVTDVRVVTGETIALLDTTGTLTQKYQASRHSSFVGSKLVSPFDTDQFQRLLRPRSDISISRDLIPTERPRSGEVLAIATIFERLKILVGTRFAYGRLDQERNRGAELHCLACQALGYTSYADTGQFPDILNQVLEIKLQTSRTVDLGLISPDSTAPAQEVGAGIEHCDVRYAVFYGSRKGADDLMLDELVVSTGDDFFTEFQRFEGMVINKKLQIPLPADFFGESEG